MNLHYSINNLRNFADISLSKYFKEMNNTNMIHRTPIHDNLCIHK